VLASLVLSKKEDKAQKHLPRPGMKKTSTQPHYPSSTSPIHLGKPTLPAAAYQHIRIIHHHDHRHLITVMTIINGN